MTRLYYISIAMIIFVVLAGDPFLFAQETTTKESLRSLVNKGVDLYEQQKYSESEINFRKGLEKTSNSFQSGFNLGDAQYKLGRYDDAIKSYTKAMATTREKSLKAKAYHNIGNSLLKSGKLDESIQAYKNALKLNPHDKDTKYNLSYALKQLKQEQKNQDKKQNKDQNKQDNKDQQSNSNQQDQQNQKDQKNDQDKDSDKRNDQQNQDQQKNNQNSNDQQKKDQNQGNNRQNEGQHQKPKIGKDEAERILDALKHNEQQLQKQHKRKTGRVLPTDKDW